MENDQDEFERQLELEKRLTDSQTSSHTYTDPNDGTVYDWDDEKRAWFPKVDEDFLAAYQANYGYTAEDTTTETKVATNENSRNKDEVTNNKNTDTQSAGSKNETGAKKRKQAQEQWFEIDESKNTNVYVSGLPDDVTMEEFKDLMAKCGIIMMNEETEELKLKLYKDNDGNLKGDGLCCYLKRESVELALQLLDESDLRGHTLSVEVAKFTQRGEYRPQKKKKNKKKKKKTQEKLLDWRPEKKDQQRKRNETVVIIKHLFHPKDFDEDATIINEIKDDLTAECGKFGEVKKVMIFDRHIDGVASVKFSTPEAADICIVGLNGRWFDKRQLSVSQWDGSTDYKVEETETEREQRLQKWDEFLQKDGDAESKDVPHKSSEVEQKNLREDKNELVTTTVTST